MVRSDGRLIRCRGARWTTAEYLGDHVPGAETLIEVPYTSTEVAEQMLKLGVAVGHVKLPVSGDWGEIALVWSGE